MIHDTEKEAFRRLRLESVRIRSRKLTQHRSSRSTLIDGLVATQLNISRLLIHGLLRELDRTHRNVLEFEILNVGHLDGINPPSVGCIRIAPRNEPELVLIDVIHLELIVDQIEVENNRIIPSPAINHIATTIGGDDIVAQVPSQCVVKLRTDEVFEPDHSVSLGVTA